MKRQIVVIAHNLRSTHNVGSLIRTSEGMGVTSLYLTGYTPYPLEKTDKRLPHLARKIDTQIKKTSLGAERNLPIARGEIEAVILSLKETGYEVLGLEQAKDSIDINIDTPSEKVAIVLGREVEGIEKEVLDLCDRRVFIPMFGKKESFNVVQAAAMALFRYKFYS